MILCDQLVACVTSRSFQCGLVSAMRRNDCPLLVNFGLSPDVPGRVSLLIDNNAIMLLDRRN